MKTITEVIVILILLFAFIGGFAFINSDVATDGELYEQTRLETLKTDYAYNVQPIVPSQPACDCHCSCHGETVCPEN